MGILEKGSKGKEQRWAVIRSAQGIPGAPTLFEQWFYVRESWERKSERYIRTNF